MRRSAIAAVLLALTAGCTATDSPSTVAEDAAGPAAALRLVAFDSCDDAMAKLKQAAKEHVGPYGIGAGDLSERRPAVPEAAAGADNAGKAAAPAEGTDYSGTNAHERGADEPDLVKTDGRRIITMRQGVLKIVDTSSKQVTGRLDLNGESDDPIRWSDAQLLLHGDRVLVLIRGEYPIQPDSSRGPAINAAPPGIVARDPRRFTDARLLLVDLSGGTARLASTYTIDGQLVDARQTGSVARIVTTSVPRLDFSRPLPRGTGRQEADDEQRIGANREIIDRSGPDDWLPRFEVTSGDRVSHGRIDCAAVSRTASYTGASMITLLSFDLNRSTLGSGDGVTVVADGQTVYGTGSSLYVATGQRWRGAVPGRGQRVQPEQRTEIYKFDLIGAGRPRYAAAGSVPGWLINQYAMSEWDGHLRVATTSGPAPGNRAASESAVYVLRQRGRQLTRTGEVTGLGKNERIYAVRFLGSVGYVVTFRQTDPLYTVDLRNPGAPEVAGELKITGYSAYLHPAGEGRLIGVGQEANERGRVQGMQISLFDVGDLAAPRRISQYHVKGGYTEAEVDPHAFLYWPKTGLLVVPFASHRTNAGRALVLAVTGSSVSEVGTVAHPAVSTGSGGLIPGQIQRAIIIDDVLWTVSDAGMRASDPQTLQTLAWVDI